MRTGCSGLTVEAVRGLHDCLATLHGADDVRAALPHLCARLRHLLNARTVMVHLPDGQVVETVAFAGERPASPLIGGAVPKDDWVGLLQTSTAYQGVLLIRERLLLAPLSSAEADGGISAGFTADGPHPDPFVAALLSLVAAQLSAALHYERFAGRSAADHLALRLSEERFRLAFDNAPIGMAEFVEDAGGLLITRINRAAGQMFGINVLGCRDELIDRIFTVADGETLGDALSWLLKDEDRRRLRREMSFVGADGKEFWGLVEAARLLNKDGRSGILCQIVDISQSRAEKRELTKRAQHDPLTGLPNRASVLGRLQAVVRQARDTGKRGALLFCDLDNFKAVNDKHGHLVGDDALAAISTRLHQTVRMSDTAGRFGGDEFIVVAFPVSQREAEGLGQRISTALAEPMLFDGAVLRIGVSIGIAIVTGSVEASEVLRRADAAMYAVRSRQHGPSFVVDTA